MCVLRDPVEADYGCSFSAVVSLISTYNVHCLLRGGGGGGGGFTLREVRVLSEWELAGYVPLDCF